MTKIELLRKLKAEDLYTSGKKLKEIAENTKKEDKN